MSTLLAASLATLVFCAPGYPGGAGDAQPLLNQFASAAVAASGWPAGSLAAVYDPTEDGGLAKLGQADAVLAFVPYPFFVEHAAQLHLTPLVQADVTDIGAQQRWTLVAKSGRVTGPESMAGYTILSAAGYAPDFVRHSALEGWALPPDVKIESTGQVLSALRRVAAGEPVAVLLDQTEAAALPSLPFAAQIQAVKQSALACLRPAHRPCRRHCSRWGNPRAPPTHWDRCVCTASCCPSYLPARQRNDQGVVLRVADACGRRMRDAIAAAAGTERGPLSLA
jgi:hypothetical protein